MYSKAEKELIGHENSVKGRARYRVLGQIIVQDLKNYAELVLGLSHKK